MHENDPHPMDKIEQSERNWESYDSYEKNAILLVILTEPKYFANGNKCIIHVQEGIFIMSSVLSKVDEVENGQNSYSVSAPNFKPKKAIIHWNIPLIFLNTSLSKHS